MRTAPFESLARDYWDAVETGKRQPLVEYGSDLDTLQYCSGFSKKLPNTSEIQNKKKRKSGEKKVVLLIEIENNN